MLRALLFDLDGTLAHTDEVHFQVWRDLLQPYGLIIDLTFYQDHFSGRLNPDIVQDLLPQLSPDAGAALIEHKEAVFRDRAQTLTPLAGLVALRQWAAERSCRQAVVTNAPRANAAFMLQALGFTDSFDYVVIAEDLPRAKPDPLPYQAALAHFNLHPRQAVVFEDSPSGVRSAVAAGIPTVGVATTQTPARLYDWGADLVIQDFTDQRLYIWLERSLTLPLTPSV